MMGLTLTGTKFHVWALLLNKGVSDLSKTLSGIPHSYLLPLQGKRRKKIMVMAETATMTATMTAITLYLFPSKI